MVESLLKHAHALAYWHLDGAARTDAIMQDHTCRTTSSCPWPIHWVYKACLAKQPYRLQQSGKMGNFLWCDDVVADILSG